MNKAGRKQRFGGMVRVTFEKKEQHDMVISTLRQMSKELQMSQSEIISEILIEHCSRVR